MSMTRTDRIENIKSEIAQLEAQWKRLLQQEKEQERKNRTKRLCKRMGLFESLLPETITLTDEQFNTFLEKTITTAHSRRILDGLMPQEVKAPTAKNTESASKSIIAESENNGKSTGE